MINTPPVPLPTHILIETTTRCNLRCKQCAHVIHKYNFADMTMETFHRLAPLFPHAREVALYAHGETFLHRHFFEMLAESKQYPISVYVTTNGTLITPEVAERLVALEFDKLVFSLDAADPELFNDIRREADFETIMRNMMNIYEYGLTGESLLRLSVWDRVSRNDREFKRSFDRKTLLQTKLARIPERIREHDIGLDENRAKDTLPSPYASSDVSPYYGQYSSGRDCDDLE